MLFLSTAALGNVSRLTTEPHSAPSSKPSVATGSRTLDLTKEVFTKNRAPQKAVDGSDIIYDAPGTPGNYLKSAQGYTLLWGSWLEPYVAGGIQATIVRDNDDYYFLDILNNADFGSYVKGVRSGDRITVSLPQTIAYAEVEDDLPLIVTLNVFKLGEMIDEYGDKVNTYYVDNSITEIHYNLQADGSWALELPGKKYDGVTPNEYALGMLDLAYNEWIGYCDFTQVYTAFDGDPVRIPDGCTTETFNCVNGISGYPVEVAIQDNDIYIKGLCKYVPELTFKAVVEGGKATVHAGQYIGNYHEYYLFTICGYKNPAYREGDPFSPEYLLAEGDFVFDYDPVNHVLSSAEPDRYLIFNSGSIFLNYIDAFAGISILKKDSYAGTPANPFALWWTPFLYDYYGFYLFAFELPMVTDDGDLLDVDSLFYSIYVDGEIMTFTDDVYDGIDGSVTLIPYALNNNWNIYLSSDTYHQIGIYTKDVEKVGVQAVYKYNGVTTASDLVTLDIKSGEVSSDSKVDDITSDSPVVSTQYFTLTGQRIDNPSAGLYVRRSLHSDGTVSVSKTVIR